MNRWLVLLLTLAVLGGCAGSSAQTYQKKGRTGLNISCSGLTSSWQGCERKAQHACGPNGYKVLAKTGSDSPAEDDADFLFGIDPAGFYSRNMVVICQKGEPS